MGAARPERALWQRYRRGFPRQWCRRPGGPQMTTPANWLLAELQTTAPYPWPSRSDAKPPRGCLSACSPTTLGNQARSISDRRFIKSFSLWPSRNTFLCNCCIPDWMCRSRTMGFPGAGCRSVCHVPSGVATSSRGRGDTLVNPFADKKALQPDPASRFCMLASPSPLTTNPSSRAGPGPAC